MNQRHFRSPHTISGMYWCLGAYPTREYPYPLTEFFYFWNWFAPEFKRRIRGHEDNFGGIGSYLSGLDLTDESSSLYVLVASMIKSRGIFIKRPRCSGYLLTQRCTGYLKQFSLVLVPIFGPGIDIQYRSNPVPFWKTIPKERKGKVVWNSKSGLRRPLRELQTHVFFRNGDAITMPKWIPKHIRNSWQNGHPSKELLKKCYGAN